MKKKKNGREPVSPIRNRGGLRQRACSEQVSQGFNSCCRKGSLQHKSLCLQSTAEVLLIWEHSTRASPPVAPCPNVQEPSVSGETYLVEFVHPFETGVTAFSICKDLILISTQYLPSCGVTCTSSAGPMPALSSIIPIAWHPFASLCTRVGVRGFHACD